MEKVSLIELYLAFCKTGLELLGGGFVIVPILTKNIIDKKRWVTRDELAKYYALSQSLPGIIAINTSVFVGYKLRGKRGALVSILGLITSPFIVICLIANILSQLTDLTIVQDIFYGVGIAVVILIYLAIKEMWNFSVVDFVSTVIFIGAFCGAYFLNLSPVIIVIVSILYGVFMKFIGEKMK